MHNTMSIFSNSAESMAPGSLNWYIVCFGIPVAIGAATCKLYSCFYSKHRKAALQGKVVVITGASSGLGEALAHVFYENGCRVVMAARRKMELERVKNDLIKKKLYTPTLEPVVLELDLAQLEDIDMFVQKAYDACGHIDILINNGGVSNRGTVLETKIEVDQKIMAVNYFGAVALTKACLPRMTERKTGHIVFVSSIQGLIAIPNRSAYAASKHAIQAFGDTLRAEMHQHNIKVTVVSPGYIKTDISINAYSGSGEAHGEMDAATASGFSSEYVANKIIHAVARKQNELIISQFLPKLAIFLRHFIPSLYFWIMAKRANRTN